MDRRAAFEWALPVSLLFGALLASCGGAAAPAESSGPPAATPVEVAVESDAPAKPPAEPAKGDVGLADKDNDRAIVDIVQQLLACEWRVTATLWVPVGCAEARTAWSSLELHAKGATLVRFLEDKDDRVRYLGAVGLKSAKDWRSDAVMAGVVLDALERSRENKVVTWSLAGAAGAIDVANTGTRARVEALFTSLPDDEARAQLIYYAQVYNSELFFDDVVGLARNDKKEEVRKEAVRALRMGMPKGKTEAVCALWLEKTKDPSEQVAADAAELAGFISDGCPKEYDALVKLFDEKTRGKLESNTWTSRIAPMAANQKVPEKNRKALAAMGKRIVEKKDNSGYARADGLRIVTAFDRSAGKAYAAKLKNDPDSWVKLVAEEILAAK